MSKLEKAYRYFLQASTEELIFRIFLLGLMPNSMGLIISTMLYSIVHFVKFTWQVPLLSLFFGYGLGLTYITIAHPYNLVVVIIHFFVGAIAWNWIKRFRRGL